MNIKQISGLLGSIILIIAVFAPIVSIPILGTMNYFQNGEGDGVIILIVAVISIFLIFFKKYKVLWVTGGISFAVMIFTFFNFHYQMSKAQSDMRTELGDNPFADFADMALQSVQLEWGWALLIVGASLLLFSAASSGMKSYQTVTKRETGNAPVEYYVPHDIKFVLLQSTNPSIPSIRLTGQKEVVVGRSRKTQIKVENKYVSGEHLSVALNQNNEVVVKDLHSSNGTYIEGRKLVSGVPTILKRGERLLIGSGDITYIY